MKIDFEEFSDGIAKLVLSPNSSFVLPIGFYKFPEKYQDKFEKIIGDSKIYTVSLFVDHSTKVKELTYSQVLQIEKDEIKSRFYFCSMSKVAINQFLSGEFKQRIIETKKILSGFTETAEMIGFVDGYIEDLKKIHDRLDNFLIGCVKRSLEVN